MDKVIPFQLNKNLIHNSIIMWLKKPAITLLALAKYSRQFDAYQ